MPRPRRSLNTEAQLSVLSLYPGSMATNSFSPSSLAPRMHRRTVFSFSIPAPR